MEKLPERFAGFRAAGLGPGAGARGVGVDERLDLLGRRRRARCVIEPHVDRPVAGPAQPREDAGLKQRGFAEAGLPEEDGEGIAFGPAREVANLLVAAVEKPGPDPR